MKRSVALKTLGLNEGASDDEIKKAHRKLVIAHHPDKFPLDSKERSDAEELTKQINESRDVLLNRTWTPEFDPRRDPRPYAGNPYARPTGVAYDGQDPFSSWPFSQGQTPGNTQGRTTYVWTSWDGSRSTGGAAPVDFDPYDPFAPFRAQRPQKTNEQIKTETAEKLRREGLIIAGKFVLLAALAVAGSIASGLFLYVMISLIYGIWKRLGGCLVIFGIPIAIVLTPFIFLISPGNDGISIALGLVFLFAVYFDIKNIRNLLRMYSVARKVQDAQNS